MDPITIIGLLASITNLIHAGRSTLRVVDSFKDGEKEIHNLSNDIAIFTEALNGFDRVLRSHQTTQSFTKEVIEVMLESSLNTMKDLESRLLKLSAYTTPTMRKLKWVQSSTAIKKLQGRLKEQNAMLQIFLSLTHTETFLSFTSLDNLSPSPYLQVPNTASHNHSRRLSSTSSISTADTSLTPTSLSSASSAVLTSTSSITSQETPERLRKDSQGSVYETLTLFNTGSAVDFEETNIEPRRSSQRDIPQALVIRQSCRFDCLCDCHKASSKDTAEPRKRFGRLKKVAKVGCTDLKCLSYETVETAYKTQSKSFFGALSEAMSSHNIQVRYNLHTYRTVSEGCDAMRFVKHGQVEKLRSVIESGEATIWDTAPDGWSLLHTAAYHRQFPIVQYLLSLGVDTESGDIGSRKPADFAILKSMGADATEVEHNICKAFSQNDDILLDFEFTPIHIAVLDLYPTGDTERPSLEELITVVDDANNAPADTNWSDWKRSFKGRSSLFGDIIEYFRAEAFEPPPNRKIIHNLLDQKDQKYHWSPLHWAAFAGHGDKMKILIQHGADPLLLSNLNGNILHTAVESKSSQGLEVALEIWKKCSDRLDINQANRWQETPLHVASWCSPACVKLLLEAGADPDLQQEDGQVALHHAGLCEQGPDRREMALSLCRTESKKHINTQDSEDRPPIFEFLDDPECVEILVTNGARLDLVDSLGMNIFHHICLQGEHRALDVALSQIVKTAGEGLITESDYSGNTPLMEALCNSNITCAMRLLEFEDLGNIISKEGWAAVHYAAKIGDPDLLEVVYKHSSCIKNMKTMNGKGVDTVAMEAGTWSGKIKELIRMYNYIGGD